MGLDVYYQAIPDDKDLLDFVKLYEIDYWLRDILDWRWHTEEKHIEVSQRFEHLLTKSLVNHPEIENRSFFTRYWDFLLYFLSENRRNLRTYLGEDIWRRIVIGGEYLHTNGHIRYLSANEVKDAANLLAKTHLDDKRLLDFDAMKSCGVYKLSQAQNVAKYLEEVFETTAAELEDLKALYSAAANHNEALLMDKF